MLLWKAARQRIFDSISFFSIFGYIEALSTLIDFQLFLLILWSNLSHSNDFHTYKACSLVLLLRLLRQTYRRSQPIFKSRLIGDLCIRFYFVCFDVVSLWFITFDTKYFHIELSQNELSFINQHQEHRFVLTLRQELKLLKTLLKYRAYV